MSSLTYFVLCDFGPKLGREWIARDPAAMDWQSTVEAIAQNDPSGAMNMIEVRRAQDWADVTQQVARAVSQQWANSGEPLTYEQYQFVELQLGTRAARSFQRAA